MRGNKGLKGRNTNSLNFWQKKLVEQNLTLHNMSDILNCSYRYTVSYFTGFIHPTEKIMKSICAALNVPIEIGIPAFDEIYAIWGNAHKDTYEPSGNTYKKINRLSKSTVRPHNKINFWLHKISGQGISVKELAIFLDKPYSTVKAYFSGFVMPSDAIIITLCKKFNVDFDRAYQEFQKIHEFWGYSHRDSYVKSGNSYKPLQKSAPQPTPHSGEAKSECLKYLYGKLAYADFNQIIPTEISEKDVLRLSYNKVSYQDFMGLLH